MSDQLKKYLQQSRKELDNAEPKLDVFDQIMERVENSVSLKPKRSSFWSNFYYSVAATVIIFIVASLFLISQMQDVSPATTKVENANQTIPKPNTASSPIPIHETTQNEVATLTRVTPKLKTTIRVKRDALNEMTQDTMRVAPVQASVVANIVNSNQDIQDEIAIEEIQEKRYENTKEENPSIVSSELIQNSVSQTESYLGLREEQQLTRKVKNGLFKLFSKKAKKWSGETLHIEKREINQQSILAFQFKSGEFEFSKSFLLNSNQQH